MNGGPGIAVLGRAGTRLGWAFVVGFLAVFGSLVILGVLELVPPFIGVQVAFPLIVSFGGLLWLLVRRSGDVLELHEDRLVARGRGPDRTWRWEELLEVGVANASSGRPYAAPGTTVYVRPDGRSFDTPGPNSPWPVELAIFGRAARADAIDVLRRACERHGVPFTDDGAHMAEQPRPGSAFRTTRRRSRTQEDA